MSEQELREMDARVALALGHRWIESPAENNICAAMLTEDESLLSDNFPGGAWREIAWPEKHHHVMGYGRKYTTDPAAADLVKKWMVAKGWGYEITRDPCITGDARTAYARVFLPRHEKPNQFGGGAFVDETALMIAVLAAVEAEKASATE